MVRHSQGGSSLGRGCGMAFGELLGERGRAVVGDDWDELFQQCCPCAGAAMSCPLGWVRTCSCSSCHPQQPWEGLDAALSLLWGLCPRPQPST